MKEQLIRVKGHRLSFWEDGKMIFETYCGYGRNGFTSEKREGDGCTPLGTFTLPLAFGTVRNPGTALEYRQIGPLSYWSGEKEHYNRWVELESDSAPMSASERLADYPTQYRYAMFIGYNAEEPEWGRGSAIFLHCRASDHWSTAGCISIARAKMLRLLRECRPGVKITIEEN